MTHLIEGINPFSITKIVAKGARRIGEHPLKIKRFKNKHPILSFFGFGPQKSVFDFYFRPHVDILVGDKTVRYITCTSNDRAVALANKLNKKLDNYIELLTLANKLQQ